MAKNDEAVRCSWAKEGIERDYHDTEWGVVQRDGTRLFEMLTLEGAQSGLSWATVLGKRENYRRAFCGFDAARVARMGEREILAMLAEQDTTMAVVRHRGKIESTISNAKVILTMREAGSDLSERLWSFVDGEPITNTYRTLKQIPSQTEASLAMSKDLKKLGFRFVGPTTCYALMQAAGMVNDHVTGCYRYAQLAPGR